MRDEAIKSIKTHRENNDLIRAYFKQCSEDIKIKNLYMLRRACMYLSIFYIVVLVLTAKLIPNYQIKIFDFLIIPLVLVYYFINSYTMKHEKEMSYMQTRVVCGIFYAFLTGIFILLDTFILPENDAFWIPMYMLIFPFVYIDRVYKYGIYGMGATITTLVISYHFKPVHVFAQDCHAVIVTYIVAMLVAHIMLEIRSSEGLAMIEIRKVSALDKLTHVLNKDALMERVENYFRQSSDPTCAVCFFDLDNFKEVNDNLGHEAGDLLLERVGRLLKDNFRSYDIIGRYGGDEFVILMPNMKDEIILKMRCRTMQMFLADYSMGNCTPFSVSIGAVINTGMTTSASLFQMADDALYESKISGKNACTIWKMESRICTTRPVLIIVTTGNQDKIQDCFLNEAAHFDILTATSSDEALRIASQYNKKVALMIVEMDVDEQTEYMTLRYMKTRERFANIPILAVASTMEQSVHARDYGADEVLMVDSLDDLYKETITFMLNK
ncbi:MAG: GGDEF domain-containing protein [Pseudobutyrivibrio sp.]|nr:GGDEF domain-containing protein [Pseudobutyrivibrio sp.]